MVPQEQALDPRTQGGVKAPRQRHLLSGERPGPITIGCTVPSQGLTCLLGWGSSHALQPQGKDMCMSDELFTHDHAVIRLCRPLQSFRQPSAPCVCVHSRNRNWSTTGAKNSPRQWRDRTNQPNLAPEVERHPRVSGCRPIRIWDGYILPGWQPIRFSGDERIVAPKTDQSRTRTSTMVRSTNES